MEINIFLCQILIWIILLLGQLHGCKSCSEIERNALLELNKYVISRSDESYLDYVLPSWTKDTKRDCCRWKGVECNRTSSRIIGIAIGEVNFKEMTPFNLSLLRPFEEVKSLNLSGKGHKNKFNGFFDDAEGYKSLRRLRNLEILDLSSNFFNSSIFPFLNAATSLTTLFLGDNKMDGPLPTNYLKELVYLELLDLSWNNFNGSMSEVTHLKNLKALDLSFNDLSSSMELQELKNWTNLEVLGLAENNFSGLIPTEGKFPSSMGEMKNITSLDLSYNNFSGNIPVSFFKGCSSLSILKISNNKLRGHFLPKGLGFPSLTVLRIQNNLFTGRIGAGLLSSSMLSYIDMSDNRLTGYIPNWIPKLQYLNCFLVANNFLKGTIPHSLVVMSSVSFLDLSGNLFSGTLPSYVSDSVKHLFLHNNNFTGPIPETLLRNVEILDLRNNQLSGSIPEFVNIQKISILLLKGNNLTGSIPRQLCDLSNIRLLDLSDNKLSGFIPPCLYNLSFGMGGEEEEEERRKFQLLFYQEVLKLEFYKSTFVVEELESFYVIYQKIEIQFAAKQRYDSYAGVSMFTEGILGYMYGMDLSNNKLSGIIPTELGNLSKIRALNLSHNLLSGSIPSSFSNLKDIESLDLSYNMLRGRIPYQLANLTSLAVFNVSYNNLSGIILQGNQFNTFKENSYLGNPLLCGLPTSKSCGAKKSSEEAHNGGEEKNDEAAFDMLFFYYSTASTYVTALIGIVVLMCLDCPWSRAWLRIVDAFIAFAKNMFA